MYNVIQQYLIRLLRLAGADRGWMSQGEVLAAQVGKYCRCCYHTKSTPEDEKLYRAEASKDVGDLIVQCMLTCSQMGLDFDDVMNEGITSFQDQMKAVTKRNKGELKCQA